MDKAQVLVRMVARAFYETEAVVIVDSLIRHVALNVSDIQFIFQNSAKAKGQVTNNIGHLKAGGLITEFTRSETKANAQKPTSVAYYYIDYRHAVDATKFKLHTLGAALRKKAGPAEEKKEYKCPRCKAEYRELDVVGSVSADLSGFLCLQCGHTLEYIEQDAEDVEATGPVGAFNRSLGWVINLMQEIDNVFIPAVTSEGAFAAREEIPRPKAPLEGPKIEITSAPTSRPTAVKGLVTGPQKVEVSISSDADNTAAAQIAAAEQKERLAAQNALPEWHTRSTVSNEMTAAGQKEEAQRREREAEMGLLTSDNSDEKKVVQDDGLADIFAEIEAEQVQERLKRERKEEEEDEEEDDEDEDVEFEDVPPVSSARAVNGSGQPDAKRVKLVDVETPVSQATPGGSGYGEESEEEFEDV
jgi:transcription initiation factor TFIIE subunit alpha